MVFLYNNLKQENMDMENSSAVSSDTETNKKKILVVEDDEFLQDMICQKLVQQGFDVAAAGDTQSAKGQMDEKKFDMVLLDLILPQMNGLDFLKELKGENSTHSNVPVMILSNLYQDDKIKEAKEAGAVDFMVKSNHSPSQIVERVVQIFADKK